MKRLIPLVLLLVAGLTACGGGSGGDTSGSLPASRPAGTVSGVAFDGVVSGGTVSIYDFSSGSKGALLGSGQTAADGRFAVSIVTPDKPIIIEVAEGAYLEEASGLQVQIDPTKGQKLAAVQLYQSGQSVVVNTTFFTTLAAGLAEHLVEEGRAVSDAVQTANAQLSAWAGFDIVATSPLNVADAANRAAVLTDPLRYGFISAALSELTRQVSTAAGQPAHSTWTSSAFIQSAYDDMRADGVLDGVGASGPISVGSTALTGDTYRATLAERLLQFVTSPKNGTGLDFDAVLPFAQSLGSNAGATFNGAPAVDFTATKPTVTQFIPADGSTISGSFDANALVSDPLGITLVEYFVDGQFVATAGDPMNPIRAIDTLNFPDGQHVVSIEVTNRLGNSMVVAHTVTFSNAGSVSGTALDGLIIGGNVSIYDFTSAIKGTLLGTGKTDNKGLYSVPIVSSDRILIEIDGGFYVEEASGVQIQVDRALGYKLSAVQLYQSGVPVTMNATFFTTVATGLVEYQVRNQGVAVTNAILSANQQVSSWAGFDIETTVPVDVSDPINAGPFLSDALRYGFASAAISELTRVVNVESGVPAHSTWPSIAFIRAAYDDVRVDGLLDGRGSSGPVAVGSLALTPEVYRATLAERLMQFVVDSRNNTTLSFDEVLPFAETLNAFAGSLFANQPAVDFKTTIRPTVTQFLPAGGDTLGNAAGSALSVIADDRLGVERVEYLVDDVVVATATNPQSPIETISTFDFANGPHTFSVRVTNLLGNTTVVDHAVTIANGTVSVGLPVFQNIADLGTVRSCTYSVPITDGAGVGVANVTQDGVSVASNLPGTSTLQLSTSSALSTCIPVAVTAMDTLGNRDTRNFGVRFSKAPRAAIYYCAIDSGC